MVDVFISHAAADSHLAEFLHRHLTQEGLSVYLASVSMPPGGTLDASHHGQPARLNLGSLPRESCCLCLAMGDAGNGGCGCSQ